MTNNPLEEQEICISCGFCCDHTLFEYASLQPEEKVEGHFKDSKFNIDGNDYFKLPCPHFNEKCTIYKKKKPSICSTFKCKLLKNFNKGEIDKERAKSIISEAKTLRQEIINSHAELYGSPTKSYRSILETVNFESENSSKEFLVLKAKTNLLSILLIRYFKSKETFDEFLSNDN